MNEVEKSYAAGLIDGEGCIDIGVNKVKEGVRKSIQYYVRVGVHITNIDVLNFLKKRWGGSIRERSEYKKNGWKPSFDWKLTSSSAIKFLKDVEPYLIIKRQEVLTALKFPEYNGSRNLKIPDQIQNERINIKEKLHSLKGGNFGRYSRN